MANSTPSSSQPTYQGTACYGLPIQQPQMGLGSFNGSLSNSFNGSLNNSQSMNSTPRATPPRSQLSTIPNGLSRTSKNGYGTNQTDHSSIHEGDFKPQIYRAIYSSISVYEMEVNGVAVMKRRADSWLNATQVLKVAGVVKAKRTKTLEKEIAAGEHEKVQGGYGKYQGTWVTFQRGLDLCREYHVEELLRPLLEYGTDLGDGSQGQIETPTKEQAMAAQRKRLYSNTSQISQPQQGTFFQKISHTAATAVNAISKARFDSPANRLGVRKSSSHLTGEQQSSINSQTAYNASNNDYFKSNHQNCGYDGPVFSHEEPEPPRKRMKTLPPPPLADERSVSIQEPTPTEPNESFCQDNGPAESRALAPATTPERFQKMKLIMTLFLDKRAKDFSQHPALSQLSGEDLEIPLDEYQNNALHWAAMLARMPLVHALVEKGVSIFRLNGAGETALQKSVGTRNNLDYRSFPRLLQVLSPTIDAVDYSGRTILHHIAVMAATGGGGHVSAKHYLEALLEFIVRHGGTSQVISLGRFISEIVNLRDDQGDTALNLAGRARSVLVPQLLEVGADPHIPNHTGLRPADYGVGVNMVDDNSQSNGDDPFMDQLAKAKKEILDSTLGQISQLVEEAIDSIDRDLTANLAQKQERFDHWHSKIRETAKARQVEQKQLAELKRKSSERIELERRIKNIERSSQELLETLRGVQGESFDASKEVMIGDADVESGVDITEFETFFPATFDPGSGFSEQQVAYLSSLAPAECLRQRIKCYEDFNSEILAEVERLRSKNVILGQNYRRMVMACTGWTVEQVDEAAEGLTQCVRELNEHPVPEDEAIEILMRDRGQDW